MALPKPVKIKNIDVLNDPIKVTEYCTTTHEYCTYITYLISDYVDTKKEIPEYLIKRYINLVCDQMLCWSLNYDKHLKNLKYILENVNFDKTIIKQVNNNNELIYIYVSTIKDINLQFIKDISKNQEIFTTLAERFINSNQNIDEIFEYVITKKYEKTLNLLLDNKFKVDSELTFFKIITSFNNSDNIVEIIKKSIANGLNITKDTVKTLIHTKEKYNYYQQNLDKIFIFLYDNGSTNFTITELCLFFNHNEQYLSNIVNHIIDNNYNITESEFLLLCEKKIKIFNISKIKHFLDIPKIKNAIYYSRINYPVEFEFNIEILQKECQGGDLAKVKNILKTVKPDTSCLEYACLGGCNNIIKLLHETYNIKFTEQCILNTVQLQSQRYNRVLTYAKNNYFLKHPLQNVVGVNNNNQQIVANNFIDDDDEIEED